VVPHDVFDVIDENNPFTEVVVDSMRFRVPNITKSPGSSLLMKSFITLKRLDQRYLPVDCC
jgi:hypothetical protein